MRDFPPKARGQFYWLSEVFVSVRTGLLARPQIGKWFGNIIPEKLRRFLKP
ncbi:hypothetical protein PF007_g31166 [Phytophthora fragariae]|uniref:Uncharacterized protein n=1 Tax=Phytophthora fragariae TaxID=53985 RepID=A0A6A3PLW9_9STRA|nr:hypothetical protein PF006_g32096 [Phytophthora fragariae]KAE9058798.1 hypothetical protein PF007_g31166 [Phytophthora fragariae]KAE9262280.1 hypothetical protein PF001_g32114 [Phytophthora fragariae]